MIKYNDILNEIENICMTLKELKRNRDELSPKISRRFKENEKFDSFIEDFKNIENEILKTEIKIKILQNNLKVVMFHQEVPKILEILSKYAGKQYGEKTKQKIYNEILEKLNLSFYIDRRWSNPVMSISRVDGYNDNIEFGSKYKDGEETQILVDNKLQNLTMDDLQLFYITEEYIEDVDYRVNEIIIKHNELNQKQKELDLLKEEYNKLTVTGLKSFSIHEVIKGSIIF